MYVEFYIYIFLILDVYMEIIYFEKNFRRRGEIEFEERDQDFSDRRLDNLVDWKFLRVGILLVLFIVMFYFQNSISYIVSI